jgi:P27 family predicted phage terminase small subunit
MSKVAATEWRRVAPLLAKQGLLTLLDRAALWAYCEAWARAVAGTAAFNAGSPVVSSDRGAGKKNPAAQIARDAATELRIWCDEFGMTPSSRGRMTLPDQQEEDEIERLIAPPRRR